MDIREMAIAVETPHDVERGAGLRGPRGRAVELSGKQTGLDCRENDGEAGSGKQSPGDDSARPPGISGARRNGVAVAEGVAQVGGGVVLPATTVNLHCRHSKDPNIVAPRLGNSGSRVSIALGSPRDLNIRGGLYALLRGTSAEKNFASDTGERVVLRG